MAQRKSKKDVARQHGDDDPKATTSSFVSLSAELKEFFESPLSDLPTRVRQRISRDLNLLPWDTLTPERRRIAAAQWDYQHDPATECKRESASDRKDRNARISAIRRSITEWKKFNTPDADQRELKQRKLDDLNHELEHLEAEDEFFAKKMPSTGIKSNEADEASSDTIYIPYATAMRRLRERLDATTPEDLAAWIFLEPMDGGIAAFTKPKGRKPSPRFFFRHFPNVNPDYVEPLMAFYFRAKDISVFKPKDYFITGHALIDRWSSYPDIRPEAFILAKIAARSLWDIHPIFGRTRATFSGEDSFPAMETGLFAISEIEEIEKRELDHGGHTNEPAGLDRRSTSAAEIRHHFRVISDADENAKWWKVKMADAGRYGLLDCRVGQGQKGRASGSLWRPDCIAGWLVDRHNKGKTGLSESKARSALKQFFGYEEVVDDLFPTANEGTRQLP